MQPDIKIGRCSVLFTERFTTGIEISPPVYSFLPFIVTKGVNTGSSGSWNFREKDGIWDPEPGKLSWATLAVPSPWLRVVRQCDCEDEMTMA